MSNPTTTYIDGIDVSDHQPGIDWPKVAGAGISFAYVKATEGDFYTNPEYDAQFQGAKAAGLFVGAYLYHRPNRPVQQQLDLYLKHVWRVSKGDLPPCIDAESLGPSDPYKDIRYGRAVPAAQVIDQLHVMCDRLKAELGRDVLIYTFPDFWFHLLGNPKDFATTNPLWYARYAPTIGPLPGGWSVQSMWQFSDNARVPGVPGIVDRSHWNGSIDRLKAFAGY